MNLEHFIEFSAANFENETSGVPNKNKLIQ
jgi:hypothetical protein